ncbi:hypothetical protein U1Q18_004152 [Sarracenia purpurea var. burkii]
MGFLQSGCEPDLRKQSLVFFNDGVYSFDLEDLLRASTEVLGKGSVGTSYKAVLEEGTTVVVKRLKDVVVTKEFEMQMEVLGRIKYDNVVPKTHHGLYNLVFILGHVFIPNMEFTFLLIFLE